MAELLAIAREALANVARHSGAEHAWLQVARVNGDVRLEVADDGRGFAADAAARNRGHHGLANMRARATGIGATFAVEAREGMGVRIIVTVPATPRAHDR